MATLVTDNFTGTNGAALNPAKWVVSATTGATATILGNRARLYTGTLDSYDGKVVIRYNGADVADAEWVTSTFWYQDAQDGHIEAWLRVDDAADPGNGYFLHLARYGTISLFKAADFTFMSIASAAYTFATGTGYKLRFRVVGSTVQAKVWLSADTEPTPWTMTVTDTTVTAAGQASLSVQGGGDPGLPVEIDDVTLTDGVSGLTRVSKTVAVSWDVRQRQTRSLGISADVRQRVTKTAAISWDVQSSTKTRVTKTVAMSWDVRQRQALTAAISWNIQSTDDLGRRMWLKRGGAWINVAQIS